MVPVDLKTIAGLALEEGGSYVVYNQSNNTVRYAEAAVAPDPFTEDISVPIEGGEWGVMDVRDLPIWVWVNLGDSASLRFNEAG